VVKEILRFGSARSRCRWTSSPLNVSGLRLQSARRLKELQKERFDFLINNAGIGIYASFAKRRNRSSIS